MSDFIRLRCSKCGTILRVRRQLIDRRLRCGECGEVVTVSEAVPNGDSAGNGQDDERSDLSAPNADLPVLERDETPIHTSAGKNAIRSKLQSARIIPEEVQLMDDVATLGGKYAGAALFIAFIVISAIGDIVASRSPTSREGAVSALVLFVGLLLWLTSRAYSKIRNRRADRVQASVRLAAEIRCIADSFFASLESLPKLLRAAEVSVKLADDEFRANAFGPYWDAVDQAVMTFRQFHTAAANLPEKYEDYRHALIGLRHTFPPLSFSNDMLPDPLPALKSLEKVVRLGQTDFRFASIWEQRTNRRALLAGFQTFGEAIAHLHTDVISSLSNIQLILATR